jgi:transposase
VNEHPERLQRLEQELQDHGKTWRLQPVVEALQAWRGVQCIVAVTRVAAWGDLTRVDNPRQLMSDLGLTPSAYASGERRRQGTITKAGHTHARRAWVEGAWADRSPAKVSRHLQRRLETLPKTIQDISWKAPRRLCQRYRRLIARGKHAHQVVVAIARELVAFMWAIAKEVPLIPSTPSPYWPGTAQQNDFNTPSEAAQPRGGATLDGVKRPAGLLVPRVRQAPDGCTSGGRQPTDSSRINRRILLAPALPMNHITKRISL